MFCAGSSESIPRYESWSLDSGIAMPGLPKHFGGRFPAYSAIGTHAFASVLAEFIYGRHGGRLT